MFQKTIFRNTRIDTPKKLPLYLGIEGRISLAFSTGFAFDELRCILVIDDASLALLD
jgi:hypothetical protein